MGSSNVVKRLFASSINRWLVPLIRPAADSPLMKLKRMTPGGASSHTRLPVSSLPFFERDFFNRFPLTRRFSHLLLRWASTEQQFGNQEWVDTPECLTLYMNVSGLKPDKFMITIRQDERPDFVAELLVNGQTDLTFGYVASRNCTWWFFLPHKIHYYKIGDIKSEIGRNSGELKVTIPKAESSGDLFNCFDLKPSVIDH